MRAALADDDPQSRPPRLDGGSAGVPALLSTAVVATLALRGNVAEELRVLAIRALGAYQRSAARDALLHLVDGGRTCSDGRSWRRATPICIAALRALAETWPADPPWQRCSPSRPPPPIQSSARPHA